jgi:hypothetical protein
MVNSSCLNATLKAAPVRCGTHLSAVTGGSIFLLRNKREDFRQILAQWFWILAVRDRVAYQAPRHPRYAVAFAGLICMMLAWRVPRPAPKTGRKFIREHGRYKWLNRLFISPLPIKSAVNPI